MTEATSMVQEDAEQLTSISLSLLSEAERFLSLDIAGLQSVDFTVIFEEHLKPFESRYEEAKEFSTGLWREYSVMSNRLDFLPLGSDKYKSLDSLCDTKKAEYAAAHTQTDRTFCVYCFKSMFFAVLVERLKGISESIVNDIRGKEEDAHE